MSPRFPYWWDKYATTSACENYDGEFTLGYIAPEKSSSAPKRFGWAVTFGPRGMERLPQYGGFWFAVGEASSHKTAERDLAAAALRAEKLCRTD
jgi:hypothetical protein